MSPVTSNEQPRSVAHELNARTLLLPYLLGLVGLCALVQLYIVLDGNHISLGSELLTGGVALYFAGFLWMRREPLGQIRFARLVAHAATYATVITSYQLHAAILAMTGSSALQGQGYLPIDDGWFGATLAMAGFWGLGLTMHAIASIAQRGFES